MRYGFWDRVRQVFLSFWTIFCPFTSLTTQKIKFLKKWKTHMKMSSFHICVPKITIIWCMLPEIWVQHLTFCYFGSFFALLPQYWPQKLKIGKKIKRYFLLRMCTMNKDSWDIRCNRQKLLSFWVIFCPFIPLANQKIKIFKKWKKTPGDIIILHLSTTNDNHMMYGSRDMAFNRQNLFWFWTIFCQNFEKKAWR